MHSTFSSHPRPLIYQPMVEGQPIPGIEKTLSLTPSSPEKRACYLEALKMVLETGHISERPFCFSPSTSADCRRWKFTFNPESQSDPQTPRIIPLDFPSKQAAEKAYSDLENTFIMIDKILAPNLR